MDNEFEDTIGRTEPFGFAGPDGQGVADTSVSDKGVLVVPVTDAERQATKPDGDGLHWYERIRVFGWKVERDGQIVKVLYLFSQLVKEPMNTTDSNGLLGKIIGIVLGLLGTLHVLPAAFASVDVQQAIGAVILAGVGAYHVIQSTQNKQATAVAVNTAQTTAIAASKTSQGLDTDGHPITGLTATAQ